MAVRVTAGVVVYLSTAGLEGSCSRVRPVRPRGATVFSRGGGWPRSARTGLTPTAARLVPVTRWRWP